MRGRNIVEEHYFVRQYDIILLLSSSMVYSNYLFFLVTYRALLARHSARGPGLGWLGHCECILRVVPPSEQAGDVSGVSMCRGEWLGGHMDRSFR